MCVVAVKYFDSVGWVGAKNRDRNYQARINIIQSNRKDIQRLYIDDELTRYTEGLNEYGVCILSASLSVKSDEKEAGKITKPGQRKAGYSSPDGKKIRDALLYNNPKDAIIHLANQQLSGSTYVFNEKDCYLLEAGWNIKNKDVTKENPRTFIYKIIKLSKDSHSVRTNHGILVPQLGYSNKADDEYFKRARLSSEKRLEYVNKEMQNINDPFKMLDRLAITPNKDKFLNPIRTGNVKNGEMVTTGQLLLVPKDRTMHYRPIYSHISFTYDKLNSPEAKTFFEIISSRRLLGFKEFTK